MLAAKSRCIAVGEIGLDYYHIENPDSRHAEAGVCRPDGASPPSARKPILIHCRTSELATPQAKERLAPPMRGRTCSR